jgi:acetyl-CoA carboxylase carboxyl transferase subunit beta
LTERTSARERVSSLTRSFEERDAGLHGGDPLAFEGYRAQLERARSDTGLSDACIWGIADIDGQRCALVVFDFAFMGGSMGVAVGEKVARAFDAARRDELPVVTITSSGGARMQEGMWSLVQMAKTVEAQRRHAAAGLPHIAVLASPTTGGVYASFASLADVIYAEPQATIGFAGPRVVAELTGAPPPSDVHTSEYAFAHGLVDAIVPPSAQAPVLARTLRVFAHGLDFHRDGVARVEGPASTRTPWERLQDVRSDRWPRAPQILDVLLGESIELRGDRSGGPDDASVVVRVGHLLGTQHNVVAIGQDATVRAGSGDVLANDGRIRPEGFRKAIRAIELGSRLDLPVVTLIDTRGADPLPSSEATGIAVAIARTFAAMLECASPTLAVLTGEGGSGGALAMAVADRVVALEPAVFSVIAPEAAATILYRDAVRGAELAERLGITVDDLVRLELVDRVIPQATGGVPADAHVAIQLLASGMAEELEGLVALPRRRRQRQRERRWRSIARPPRGRQDSRGASGGLPTSGRSVRTRKGR